MADSAPAQVTYTSNVIASPEVVGAILTVGASFASGGVHVLSDPATQQQIVFLIGIVLTGVMHYFFPGASGKLGITAPMPWATPASQYIQPGTSAVTIPHTTSVNQTTEVVPLSAGSHKVDVPLPPAPPPLVIPSTVIVTPIPAASPAPQ